MSKTQTTLSFIACFINIFILAVGQVPPGVNPNHYQQPQQIPQQQYQQQPQYQQQQFQQQQFQQQPPPPPVQQQQQQQQQYQPPPQQPAQGHGHGHHHGEPQLLNTANIGQEREHIKEHLDVPIDTSTMSEKELQYHYFTMHDADKNNKLDGCELIKSLIHWHDEDDKMKEYIPKSDDFLAQNIDPILASLDTNNDGFIDFVEFKMSSVHH